MNECKLTPKIKRSYKVWVNAAYIDKNRFSSILSVKVIGMGQLWWLVIVLAAPSQLGSPIFFSDG